MSKDIKYFNSRLYKHIQDPFCAIKVQTKNKKRKKSSLFSFILICIYTTEIEISTNLKTLIKAEIRYQCGDSVSFGLTTHSSCKTAKSFEMPLESIGLVSKQENAS